MKRLLVIFIVLISAAAVAQQPSLPLQAGGTLVLMTGAAEVELANDEAVANFYYEAQDADLTRAQSTVNQRVGDGTAALRRADPKAQIETSDRKSTRLNSSHLVISYAVFCLK